MAVRSFLLCLLWLRQLDYNFVAAQGATVTLRLCLWPQLESKTFTCSSDGTSIIFVRSIVMTRLIGGLTTCTTARSNDAPELNDCRVTLGTRDSYYVDVNRLCSDKPSCTINSNNVAAYVGQTLCGLGMENSTIRNLVVLTLQCYAVPVTTLPTTATTRTTTTARQAINSSPVVITQQQSVPAQPTVPSLIMTTHEPTDNTPSTTVPDDGTAKVIAGASVAGAIALFGIVALLVWLRRRGVDRCCSGLAGNKRGRFGGSGGLEPLYDDVLMDEKGGDGEGGGRAVEQLRRMIAEEQSKQARKSRKHSGSRASASASGRSAGRRHRHRSSRHVHAESDDDGGGSGATRRRSHHRSASKAGHSTTATSRHGGGHRHHRHHRSRHQHKQRSSAGRHRARLSSKQLADGGEWRRSTEISDDQSSIADVELLSCVEGPAVAGEEAAAGDEWVDETPSLGASATTESGLSSEGAPDGGGELAKPRSSRRPHHRRTRGEAKASRTGTKGAGKTSRSSRTRSSDAAAATTTLDISDDGEASQPINSVAGAASSRERRHRHSRQSRSLAAGINGAVVQGEVATGVQESDGIAGGAGASLAASALDAAETEAVARSGRSRRERESESRSVRCRRPSGDGGRADAVPTAGGERKRSSGKSERAAKSSRRGDRSEGRSSSRRHRDANDDGAAAAASDGAAVRVEGGDERKRRRQRRVQLPKTKSRSSQKRSLRRKEYEMRRNDKFLSGSSASDSDVAAAVPSRPSDGCQLAGSHPSAELLEMMKSQQEQRRRRLLEQQQQQSEKRGRRSKEKKSGSHYSKTEGKKRRTSAARTSAAATGGGASRPYNVQPLAAEAAAEVAEIVIQKDAELASTSGTADVRDAVAVSVSGQHPGGYGSLTALSHYQELSAASGRADERTYATLGHSVFPLEQENSSVCARNSTIVACELLCDTATAAAACEDGVYHCAVVVDANQNMTGASVCSICLRREENCECLNSVLVDAFSHSTVAPNRFALSA